MASTFKRFCAMLFCGLLLISCTQLSTSPNREKFLIPEGYRMNGVRFDDQVFMFSVPADARIKNREKSVDGYALTYSLERNAKRTIEEIYFAILKTQSNSPIADTLEILKEDMKSKCGYIIDNLVSNEPHNNQKSERRQFTCHNVRGRLFDISVQVTQKENYITVIKVTSFGIESLTEQELGLITKVMLYNANYDADTIVKIFD